MTNPRGTRFTVARFRPGYAIDQVDDLIDRIERTLAGQAVPGALLTADDVRRVLFRVVRLRSGYDQREVDEALSDYEERLAELDP
ncbi:MAG TPA: DivIVA domain-containing protein [Streptosporangiaceae bacterium]|nr:DivIVA domain-containing protein [Streptosporangiaceae bacterium]